MLPRGGTGRVFSRVFPFPGLICPFSFFTTRDLLLTVFFRFIGKSRSNFRKEHKNSVPE